MTLEMFLVAILRFLVVTRQSQVGWPIANIVSLSLQRKKSSSTSVSPNDHFWTYVRLNIKGGF